ncbi:MAG: Rab family GTPase [Candidatus Helarchaeota archaeon]
MSNVRFRFKLVLVGEGAVGKTSIRQKYMGKGFSGEYLKTIGADFASKVVEIKDSSGDVIKSIFQIWDLAGQVEFKEVRASFYGGCQGVLLVFDLTRKDTMDKLKDWILEAAKNSGGSIKGFYLIGNKCDLPNREITLEEGKKFAQFLSERLKFEIPYIETSAKTGENIDFLFQSFCRTFLLKEGFEIPAITEPTPPPETTKETTQKAGEITPPPVPTVPSIPNPPPILDIPPIPEPPSSSTEVKTSTTPPKKTDLEGRIEDLEKRVKQIEKYLSQIGQILKDLIK